MCTNRSCYEGECLRCQKIDSLYVYPYYYVENRYVKIPQKTEEEKEESKVLFKKLLRETRYNAKEYMKLHNKLYGKKENDLWNNKKWWNIQLSQ